MAANSTRKAGGRKRRASAKGRKHFVPPKPYPSFPLTPHASGKWMKKIKGTIYYFGNWGRVKDGKLERVPGDGWEDALKLYESQAADLHAGREPQLGTDDKLTLKQLVNLFLTAMHRRLQAGKRMSPRMFAEYRRTAEWLVAQLGKNRHVASLRPIDLASLGYDLGKRYGAVRQANEIQKVKTIFKYAADSELIAKLPNYGPEFRKPTKSELRKERNAGGKRLFTAAEIHRLLDGGATEEKDEEGKPIVVPPASAPIRAMILLGINCGFGNNDVASLPLTAVDLDAGWIDFPRPKTGIGRRVPLWPETVSALRAAIGKRPLAKGEADADCVFVTKQGNRYVRERVTLRDPKGDADDYSNKKVVPIDSVGLEFNKRLKALHINGRKGLGFYTLRHSFRTVADATKDFPAVRLIMGHADGSIDDIYREDIGDDRLRRICEHVRGWLFGAASATPSEGGAA